MGNAIDQSLMDEISSSLADIAASLEGPALAELSVALVDIAASMEKPRPADPSGYAGVIDAIKSLRISGPTVNVSPTPINVLSEPVVHIVPADWTSLDIKINRGQYGSGPMESFTITKVR